MDVRILRSASSLESFLWKISNRFPKSRQDCCFLSNSFLSFMQAVRWILTILRIFQHCFSLCLYACMSAGLYGRRCQKVGWIQKFNECSPLCLKCRARVLAGTKKSFIELIAGAFGRDYVQLRVDLTNKVSNSKQRGNNFTDSVNTLFLRFSSWLQGHCKGFLDERAFHCDL